MPPHAPYTPAAQSYLEPIRRWLGAAAQEKTPPGSRYLRRAPGGICGDTYDQYVANLDAEFGRLLDHLETSGLLDTSYLILTSDHGEIFERGAHGHSMPLVFEPNIRVPLIISAPGQRQRQDVHRADQQRRPDALAACYRRFSQSPDWSEGLALPGLGGVEQPDRSIYVVEAKANPAYEPLRKATLALIRGRYKLIHYLGYRYYRDNYEFYDLEADPDEVDNIYSTHPAAKDLQAELDQKLDEVNQPYL